MHYFFDILDGGRWSSDDEGTECKSDWSARRQAVLALCDMAREQLPENGAARDLAVRVRVGKEIAFTVHLDFSLEPGLAMTDNSIWKVAH